MPVVVLVAIAAALVLVLLPRLREEPSPGPALLEELRPLNPVPGEAGRTPPPAPDTPWIDRQPAPAEHPLEPATEAVVLPVLGDSDPTAQEALGSVVGSEALARYFEPRDLIRRIVVTVDNLAVPGGMLPVPGRILKPVAGAFITAGEEDEQVIGPDNDARYAGVVALAERVDPDALVARYSALYPLFQRAYEELGYPDRYFNDRVVEVIDHLLAAPTATGPIRLVQPRVRYEFADAELEALSPGHKIMLRIGPENAARLKTRLEAVRRALVAAERERE